MSALGEYVYLNKKNYFNNNHNSTKNKIHYQENIFSDHKDNIIKSIRAVNMENMETKYNNVLEKTFDSFSKLFTEASEIDRTNFLKYLLKDSTLSNSTKLDEIISKIEVDKDRMLLTYNPHGVEKDINSNIKVKRLRGKKDSFLSTLQSRCIDQQKELKVLQEMLESEEDKKACEAMYNMSKAVKEELDNIEKYYNGQQQILSKLNYFQGMDFDQMSKWGKTFKIPSKMAEEMRQIIDKISSGADVLRINIALQSHFSEVMTQLVIDQVNYNIYQTLADFEKKMRTPAGRAQVSNMPIATKSNPQFTINYKGIDKNIVANILNETIKKEEDKIAIGDIKGLLEVKHNTVSQKADIVYEIGMEDSPIGISVKNYDLSELVRYNQKTQDYVATDIPLQESVLKIFLLGMEQQKSGLGTHYLNIFAINKDDPDEEEKAGEYSGKLKRARQAAQQSLSLYILYSSLSGYGQGRIATADNTSKANFADILIVYDKKRNAKTRAKFFSFADIIDDIVKKDALLNPEIVNISPKLSTLHLRNNKVKENASGKELSSAIRTRLAAVVAQTQQIKIHCGLTRKYLQNFYNNKQKI